MNLQLRAKQPSVGAKLINLCTSLHSKVQTLLPTLEHVCRCMCEREKERYRARGGGLCFNHVLLNILLRCV